MTAIEIAWRDLSAHCVCVGNVSLTCLGDKRWSAPASDGALGLRHQGRGPRIFATDFPACTAGGVVIAHSDGVPHRKVHRNGLVHEIRRDPLLAGITMIAEDLERHDDSTVLLVLPP